jgi:chromate transporter
MTGPTSELAKPQQTSAGARSAATLASIFWSFFKIGAFTFGGGWAMIPLIRKELVAKKGWLQDSEFVDLLAVAQSAPGPIAINTSVITGYKMRKLPGALVAALGSSFPSFLVILAFATFLLKFRSSSAVEAVFKGMRPAIFGLLVSAVLQVGKTSVKTRTDAALALAAGILLLALKVSPIAVVAIAAVAGVALGRFSKENPKPSNEPDKAKVPGEEG